LDARTQPLLRSFIDGYLGLMAGDLGALSKGYALAFEGKVDGAWTLTMKPKDPRLASLIESIAMTGTGTKVSRMVLRETSGDVSTTEFSEVNVAKTYDKAEEKRVFRLIE
ncbi:MAG: hypothetical protein KC416_12745, partial [Myxococcales bacterium]|nr:hypothetical protein [Myxococcales bacterium]